LLSPSKGAVLPSVCGRCPSVCKLRVYQAYANVVNTWKVSGRPSIVSIVPNQCGVWQTASGTCARITNPDFVLDTVVDQKRFVIIGTVDLREQECFDFVVNDTCQAVTVCDHNIVGRHKHMLTIAQINNSVSREQTSVLELLSKVKGKRTANIGQRVDTVFLVDDKLVAQRQSVKDTTLGAAYGSLS
jgi:hypothetical protein